MRYRLAKNEIALIDSAILMSRVSKACTKLKTWTSDNVLFYQFCIALLTMLMMTAESMLSKRPVSRITMASFSLQNCSHFTLLETPGRTEVGLLHVKFALSDGANHSMPSIHEIFITAKFFVKIETIVQEDDIFKYHLNMKQSFLLLVTIAYI